MSFYLLFASLKILKHKKTNETQFENFKGWVKKALKFEIL